MQQRSTRQWWETQRTHYQVVTSELVLLEASAGDATAAKERLEAVAGTPVLKVNDLAIQLANDLVREGAIPKVADRDALHVGICAANSVDYLLTWNFRHLANAVLRDKISEVCREAGYKPPVICTPDELFRE